MNASDIGLQFCFDNDTYFKYVIWSEYIEQATTFTNYWHMQTATHRISQNSSPTRYFRLGLYRYSYQNDDYSGEKLRKTYRRHRDSRCRSACAWSVSTQTTHKLNYKSVRTVTNKLNTVYSINEQAVTRKLSALCLI